ncbi:uncharacterized protein LOC117323398 [Pecten maximus]|uniref:uncharacterized protein LOC117323398 n=1 Tax=Pecten maximus TaxID=6579 RepID=UPI001458F0BD|nr:uncharacterized protein LOC117323398 [Pecten maximus]
MLIQRKPRQRRVRCTTHISAMPQAVFCLLLLLARGSLTTASRPEFISAGHFLNANSRPLSGQTLGNHGPYMFHQRPMLPSQNENEVSRPSNNAGVAFAPQLIHDYFKPGKESYGQGSLEQQNKWPSNFMATRPKPIQMTLAKNSRPMLGLLKQLMAGRFHIVADAIHLDAVPIIERPMQPYIEGMIIEPDSLITSVHSHIEPIQPMHFELPESARPEHVTSLTNARPNNGVQQVPFQLLLKEFNDLAAKINLKPNEHAVTFSSLYQNYMKLLEQQNKTASPPILKTTLPTTTAKTESTAPPTTSETRSTIIMNVTPTTSDIPMKTKDDFNMIQTSFSKAKDDKPAVWLPGMGPEMTSP